jgi:light-harvesting complex 1 alpha chain
MLGVLMRDLYKIWLIFDPRRVMIAVLAFLSLLALFIHMLLLSTDRYNWVEGTAKAGRPVAAQQVAPPSQGQAQ